MVPFLKQVAMHYHDSGAIGDKCFVFPNRRSLTFFKKYLSEEVRKSGTPVLAPEMYSIDDFLYRLTPLKRADRISLLLELYESYRRLSQHCESLDDFIFWGDVLLGDFDDVDKYLIEARKIFTNVAQFKEMQKPQEYLSESQLEAINEFLGHFAREGAIKTEFRRIWDILLDLYNDFRENLRSKGLSYQGMAYRDLAERFDRESAIDIVSETFPQCGKFVFVGMNALTECEKKIFAKLRDASLASFCWDYGKGWISEEHNKSRFFLSKYVEMFPSDTSFVTDGSQELANPKINVVSVSSTVGQAKLLPKILKECGEDAAIVIPDENLLIPVLNSIPESRPKLNVTMGYPVGGSQIWALMDDVSTLQMTIRIKAGKPFFYFNPVVSICANSIVDASLCDEDRELVNKIRKDGKYYIPQEDFASSAVLSRIFVPLIKQDESDLSAQVKRIIGYQKDLVNLLAPPLREVPHMALELDFAMEFYKCVCKMERYNLEVKAGTYFRILRQIFGKSSVPFEGEPVEGLQIMGPLETRCLDFENLIILNCNEGVFPRKSVSSSFIPAELRRGFDMPTYEFQDAMWAYYFYRMIRRSSNVWMLFNSSASDMAPGEESRYIKQLEMHYLADITRYYADSPLQSNPVSDVIEKTQQHIDILKQRGLSPSAIGTYKYCQAQFYYERIEKLKPEEEASERLEADDFGTVFHESMEQIYREHKRIDAAYIDSLLSDKERIRDIVRKNMLSTLKTVEVTGRNIILEDVIRRYVIAVLELDKSLIVNSSGGYMDIIDLESPCKAEICGIRFNGIVDRIDSFSDGTVRVVDYKTGKIDEEKFDRQLFVYDICLDESLKDKKVTNVIYNMPTLPVKGLYRVEVNEEWKENQRVKLQEIIDEICDLSKPFARVANTPNGPCENCKFKNLCGR